VENIVFYLLLLNFFNCPSWGFFLKRGVLLYISHSLLLTNLRRSVLGVEKPHPCSVACLYTPAGEDPMQGSELKDTQILKTNRRIG